MDCLLKKMLYMFQMMISIEGKLFFYFSFVHLSEDKLQSLYECEQERIVYKACLRETLKLKRTDKHSSWKTADISALYLS